MFDGVFASIARTSTARVSPQRPARAGLGFTAEYIGPAREGRGEVGGLYRASNGITYFIPTVAFGHQSLPVVDEAEEVISNPTGFYGDMLFISVSPHLMARGLRRALQIASQEQMQQENCVVSYC